MEEIEASGIELPEDVRLKLAELDLELSEGMRPLYEVLFGLERQFLTGVAGSVPI